MGASPERSLYLVTGVRARSLLLGRRTYSLVAATAARVAIVRRSEHPSDADRLESSMRLDESQVHT